MVFFWIVLFLSCSKVKSANYSKCTDATECDNILLEDDEKDPSIFGICVSEGIPGTCFISYDFAPTLNFNATLKDPPSPDCVKSTVKSEAKICQNGLTYLRKEYDGFLFTFGNVYHCPTRIGKKTTYLTCSMKATEKRRQTITSKSNLGCQNSTTCRNMLTDVDKGKQGIFKLCFDIDDGCKKDCDGACGFAYAKLASYNETARIPNKNCRVPEKADGAYGNTRVMKACSTLVDDLKAVLKHKVTPFNPAGYICTVGGKKLITCVAQLTQARQK